MTLVMAIPYVSKKNHELFIYEYRGSSVSMMTHFRSGGTGFQVQGKSGIQYTMTNRHICDGLESNESVGYKDAESEVGRVKIIYRDEKADLCLLEAIPHLRPIPVAWHILKHEDVFLVGHPGLRGLTMQRGYVIESVEINILNYCFDNPKNFCDIKYDTYHINAISYGGNSGSPVMDMLGQVIGVLFAGSRGQNTASYMVPLEDVQRVLELH